MLFLPPPSCKDPCWTMHPTTPTTKWSLEVSLAEDWAHRLFFKAALRRPRGACVHSPEFLGRPPPGRSHREQFGGQPSDPCLGKAITHFLWLLFLCRVLSVGSPSWRWGGRRRSPFFVWQPIFQARKRVAVGVGGHRSDHAMQRRR